MTTPIVAELEHLASTGRVSPTAPADYLHASAVIAAARDGGAGGNVAPAEVGEAQ